MKTKKFYADLSESSLEQLKKQLESYKSELMNKTRTLVQRLAEQGVYVAEQNVGGFGKYITFSIKTESTTDGCKAIMVASENGKIVSMWQNANGIQIAPVSPLLMCEFGSGWGAENPMNIPGVGQGTFPDQTHAFQGDGWYWIDLDGNVNHSKGINAKMPMYKASLRIKEIYTSTVQEVFGK